MEQASASAGDSGEKSTRKPDVGITTDWFTLRNRRIHKRVKVKVPLSVTLLHVGHVFSAAAPSPGG